jgi:hypothetical protein
MSHLSPSEFVDLAEDTLAPARAAHVETCEHCRAQADVVRAALRETMAVDVPEPSPLFWEHLQARVREGVEHPPRRSRWEWTGIHGFAPLPAAIAIVLAAGLAMYGGGKLAREARPAVGEVRDYAAAPAGAITDQGVTPVLEPDDSAVWAVLTAAAQDLGLEDAQDVGMHVPPATIDRAVQGMSPDELNELGRLLQSELKHSTD